MLFFTQCLKQMCIYSLLSLLLACSGSEGIRKPSQLDPGPLLLDHLFPEPSPGFALESSAQLFDLLESTKRELDIQVSPWESEYERYEKLRRWAFQRFEFYEFDSLETTSLLELNSNRKINCLSFSAMFVAAARYVNVPAQFQLVFAPPYWDRANGSWINNQHINVTGEVELPEGPLLRILPEFSSQLPVYRGDFKVRRQHRYVADVNPAITNVNVRRQRISEEYVTSLYYSNKSVERLLENNLGEAYLYAKEALQHYPDSASAWNNLGVLYARINQPRLAITAYEQAIDLDDNAYSARSNLARLYRTVGDFALARKMESAVEEFRNQNPYYHAALAEQELAEGNLRAAQLRYRDAVEIKHNEQYFYHQLAIINQALNESDLMIENLRKARRFARGEDKSRFSNKLKALEKLL